MDAMTDIPFFLVSIVGKSYIGNLWITLDTVVKGVVFIRGLVWIPFQLPRSLSLIPGTVGGHHASQNSNGQSSGVTAHSTPNQEDKWWTKCIRSEASEHCLQTKRTKILLSFLFVAVTGCAVYGLSTYLGWSAEQYALSLLIDPTMEPTFEPTIHPSLLPTTIPTTSSPTYMPSAPSLEPTAVPTLSPATASPAESPTLSPSLNPTRVPTLSPSTASPTASPTADPSKSPTASPTFPDCGHGEVDETGSKCICREQYTTYPLPDHYEAHEVVLYCNYKQKKQVSAFCLHFFFGPLGAGHWYIGSYRYLIAALQLVITLLSICLSCIGDAGKEDNIFGIGCSLGCVTLFWWVVDMVLFGINYYADGNGVDLYEW